MSRHFLLSIGLVFTLLALLGSLASGDVEVISAHGLVRLPDGNTLLTDGGQHGTGRTSRILEVAPDGHLVRAWLADILWAHNAQPLGGGAVLVSDTGNDRVVEIDAESKISWDSETVSPLSDGSHLRYPNDVDPLSSGNLLITDRDNHRILEIDHAGNVVWQFGVTGIPGADLAHLSGPHNADRLPDGHTIVADSGNDRIMEVDTAGTVVWLYQPTGPNALSWPRDADRLPGGNTLITDSRNDRILEVTPGGTTVWELRGVAIQPYEADRLASGRTLIADSGNTRAVEVDRAGNVLWQYPGTIPTTYREVWVRNPTSGVDLNTHVHEPVDAGADRRYPAYVWIPGGSGTGQSHHFDAERMAGDGFIAVHFDPDGRGLSTNGGTYTDEDYCGFLQQDGLRAVLEYVAALPEVDADAISVLSNSYGITMASGMLARWQDLPPIRSLIDWEGPASRDDTALVNGGHVPVDPSDDLFWSEREAVTFMPNVLLRYVRLQSATDHNPNITDNHHAVMLLDAATNAYFGGSGISIWTRANRSFDNDPNLTYTIDAPPVWLDDLLDQHKSVLQTLLLHESSASPTASVGGNLVQGGHLDITIDLGEAMGGQMEFFAFSLGGGPTRLEGVATLHLDLDPLFWATLWSDHLDAGGRLSWHFPIPDIPEARGTFYAQSLYLHPGSMTGFSTSTGLRFTISGP